MDLYFLGTGAGLPSKQRNVTAIALRLLQERGTFWLFDCGEGTQQQMLSSPLRAPKLEKIFVTHLHGDHIYGIPGLLGSKAFQSSKTPLTIYGPAGIQHYIETVMDVSQMHLTYALDIQEIDEGLVFEDEQFRVTCMLLSHGVPSYGYRIEEKDSPGVLLKDKLAALHITPGPIYKELKAGRDVVTDAGRVLTSADFLGPTVKGRTVVICGDTTPCAATPTLATDADVLVHEATYGQAEAERANQHNHSTTIQAATIAKAANAQMLILTHISARYDEAASQRLVAEAKAVFTNTIIAKDHLHIEIPRSR